jgi:hypothetical protein
MTDKGTYEDYIYADALITGTLVTEGVKNPLIHFISGNHDWD